MTPRQETILFVMVTLGAIVEKLLEVARNKVRDVVDDYPLWSVVVLMASGAALMWAL